jgi:hypothetical protein
MHKRKVRRCGLQLSARIKRELAVYRVIIEKANVHMD